MRLFAGRAAWLLAVWLFLWEEVSFGNVLTGLAVATAVLLLFPPRRAERRGRFRPVAALKFLVYFHYKLVQASGIVAWEIVTPRNRINEGVVAVRIRHFSDALTTLLANAISLTPGTLTIEVDRDATTLYVHVLHLKGVEDVRREVQKLELMAVRAFGNEQAVRQALEDSAELVREDARRAQEDHP
ncbi:MAG TPA: Na+/H+ antiporter subunit E [Actinomycetota bacterium]|nr:Na+/H+ antiporter subunit E [Actinomycetota bacterium]